jgi:lipoprotein-anchoring transpeptidase ErfK/SrfK
MKQRSFIALAAGLAALIVAAVAIYVYDSSNDDEIAKGVTVATVDVGGMSTGEAREAIERRVARPLERPLTVQYRKRRYVISARRAGLRPNVDAMVDGALEASRSGNILSRVARDITGGEEEADVAASVGWSRPAMERFVARVERGVNRKPRDASLNFPSLTRVKEKNGRRVRSADLERRIRQALTVPTMERVVQVPVKITRPKVTRKELAAKYPRLLVVDRGGFRLSFYRKLKLVKSYTVAIGQAGYDTPAGMYRIQNKAVNPAWNVPNSSWAGSLAGRVIPPGPQNPLKARWMGIYDGAGIHGTDQVGSLGTAASRGCIRMAIPEVIELYDKVPVNTPVYVA